VSLVRSSSQSWGCFELRVLGELCWRLVRRERLGDVVKVDLGCDGATTSFGPVMSTPTWL
jgi:hypothetical protein